MNQLRFTQHFEVPVEQAFELAIDYKRLPEWNVSYVAVDEVTGPPDKVGTKIYAKIRLLGRTMEGWAKIVEIERPRLVRMTGTSTQGGSLTTTYRFTPVGTGSDIEILAEYELPGMFGQVADKLFVQKAIERDVRHSLENFKAFVEVKTPVLA
ncbi:MAG TPA: SRPBCC family protein [Candidatus Limnocylindrales bacterium]|nr:SRPBCC family protein [Candidatus Limnocylindrales bacterium]